jgi:hypothetical protein
MTPPAVHLTLGFALGLVVLGSACTKHSVQAPSQLAAHALTPLLPPSRMPFDFMWRQRVTAEWPTGKDSFDAVLQKRGSELVLVGLSPMGLPGFALTLQEDGTIRVENRMGRALPFEPAYVLADVQRVFFPWFSEAAPSDGTRAAELFGQYVRETYAHGTLVTREMTRSDAPEAGSVRIEYGTHKEGQDAPAQVTLDNAWYRYRLSIETFEQSRL